MKMALPRYPPPLMTDNRVPFPGYDPLSESLLLAWVHVLVLAQEGLQEYVEARQIVSLSLTSVDQSGF